MIIIDEGASFKLSHALKHMAILEGKHSIRIYAQGINAGYLREQVIALTHQHSDETQLYFCEDNEIFILTGISSKESRKLLLDITANFGEDSVDKVGEIYDLLLQTGTLLGLLEKKIAALRSFDEALLKEQQKKLEAARHAQMRKKILGQDVRQTSEEIAAQRRLRGEPTIMMIEDDAFSRRLVENILKNEYRIRSLESAEDALTIYANTAPDLLFLDINLPDVTGHELLEKIMTIDPKAYVVMLSGNADKNNIIQAMQRGAVGFVAKPFSREKLLQYVERCPTLHKEQVL